MFATLGSTRPMNILVFSLSFQNALTEQKINLKEVDQEVLGTFNEKHDPKQNVKQ